MNINTNGEYNKIQINFSQDKTGSGEIIKQSLLLNIREESVEKAVALFRDLKARIEGEEEKSGKKINPGRTGKKKEVPVCPKCGKPMLLRRNGQQGNYFWGCSSYPLCNGTRQHESEKQVPAGEALEFIEV